MLKVGDIVARKSYKKDIVFEIESIIEKNDKKYAILKGLTIRIEADGSIDDLEKVEERALKSYIENEKRKIDDVLKMYNSIEQRIETITSNAKILHLDGDKKYAKKSEDVYKELGLNAIVKNIPEYRQPNRVQELLIYHMPDILVLTGHDAMLKNGRDYYNINNYRNSKYFIKSVKEARKIADKNELIIFAGACQSYFEAIMKEGANFASSPSRILLDFIDPVIVASKIAITENNDFVSMSELARELKDGTKGVGGIGAYGKNKIFVF